MSQQKILIGDIISRYAAGERDFSEVMIDIPSYRETYFWERGQFKGLDLSGIILRNSSIQWIKLYMGGVILRDADLTNVDLGESDLTGADLSNARMRGVRIFQSVFEAANLSGADLAGAVLVESDFYDPYETPNLLFFGDNTTSAAANIDLQSISVLTT